MAKSKTAITPTRQENYPEWYQQVIRAAELAESSPARGCMVIKPWGYALWENIQRTLDRMFKATGHRNAYFPLLIPISLLEKEAEHVEGFAKECAVVTHHRLEAGPDGGLVPAGELEEPLVVRPTSETIIGAMFAKWVQSYRDLPLLINQWANVVRWEMRPRLFLRTVEFLWQEGHTVHATKQDAMEHTMRMLNVYTEFAQDHMAMPVIQGRKSENERFPGAEQTYSIEAMMQDGKALQAGTSHFLGQNFAKASGIQFLNEKGKRVHAWTTSWGVSTRLIGALIMSHGDDDGLVLPPKLAPAQVAIIPITFKAENPAEIFAYCERLRDELQALGYGGERLTVELDDRDIRGGEKVWSWVKKGVPIRLEIGPRDMAADAVYMSRRDRDVKQKQSIPRREFVDTVGAILDQIQANLLQRAQQLRDRVTREIDSKDEFYEFFKESTSEQSIGGYAVTHWCGDAKVEQQVQNDLGVTLRCIPFDGEDGGAGTCIFTGQPSPKRVVWAVAY